MHRLFKPIASEFEGYEVVLKSKKDIETLRDFLPEKVRDSLSVSITTLSYVKSTFSFITSDNKLYAGTEGDFILKNNSYDILKIIDQKVFHKEYKEL